MHQIPRLRFSLRTLAMLVLTAAVAAALFARIAKHSGTLAIPGWHYDVPALFVLAIALTAVALGSWKEHTAVQTMLQITLSCLGCLILIWICEVPYERALRYWFQATFAATVSLPLVARRIAKTHMARGPRRTWWKHTCEAVFFSFLNMMLVTVGGLLEAALYAAAQAFRLNLSP